MGNTDVSGFDWKQFLAGLFSSNQGQQQQLPRTATSGVKPVNGSFGGLNIIDLIGGAGGLASIYMGNQANKLAKDQYNTNKAFGNANLANQIKNYNTQQSNMYQRVLDARKGSGVDMASLEEYMAKNGLNTNPIA